jgi:hypothetical protein
MSEPNGAGEARGGAHWMSVWTAIAVACVTGIATTVVAGAEARSTAVPANVSPPTVAGAAVVGESLTAASGSWTGTPPISFTFAWQRCDAAGANCAPIAGETGQSYSVVAGDVGSTLRVFETGTNAEGSATAQSAATEVVTPQAAPTNTAEPVISGSAVEGFTLTASTGSWTGTSLSYAYRWVRCDAGGGLPDGSDCPSIPGASGSSYTLTADDVGRRLRVQVTASNATGSGTATANPTDVVQQSTTTGAPRNIVEPSLSGTFAVGRLVVASPGTWAGATPLSYAYQWVRCGSDGGLSDGSNCTFISGATSSTYLLTVDDIGGRLRIRVTVSNSLGVQTVASNASPAVTATSSTTPAAQAPVNSVLPSVFGSTTVGGTLTASVGLWTGTAPLLYSYQWLRCGTDGGQANGAGCSAIAAATGTQYVPVTADLGQRLRVQVTVRNGFGTTTATSNATTQIQAAGTTTPPPPPTETLPPGAVKLPNGTYSIPVTSVSPPQRLVASSFTFTPSPVRSRTRPIVLRVRVVDTRGYAVRDALVFARSTPLVTTSPGEVRSGRDGWATVRLTPRRTFPLDGNSVQFWIRVRKATDPILAGVSNRRLVQVATVG